MQIRKTFWVFVAIALVSTAAGWVAGRYSTFPDSRIVFLRLSVLTFFVIVVSWIWTYIATRKISVVRLQRVLRLPVGNVFEERFDILNQMKYWRLWVEIEDLSTLPGNSGSKVLSQISPRQDRFYISRTLLIRRGAYKLSPTLLRSGDPFGMFVSEKLFTNDKTLVVLPYIEYLEEIRQPPGFFIGGETVRQKSLEATSIAAGVRDYQPGDPLNRIHWRSSARRDRFMVKEFERDPQGDVWILLDANEKVHFDAGYLVSDASADSFWAWRNQEQFRLPASTFEYAVSIAATLANYYTKTEKAVGLAAADSHRIVIHSEKGERQFGKMMDTLAYLEGKGQLPLDGLVESVSPQIPRGSSVFLITSGSWASSQVGIEILLRKRLNPVMITLDRATFGDETDPASLENTNSVMPFPHLVIQYGDSLSEKLQKVFTTGHQLN